MKTIKSADDMKAFGAGIGTMLRGGEVIELVGDVGTGKTTFTKGLGEGLKISEDIQSPTFTISREYPARDGLEMHHYDFYRLNDPGVVSYELAESVADGTVVTVVEWGETTRDVLPVDRIIIRFAHGELESREIQIELPEAYAYLCRVSQ